MQNVMTTAAATGQMGMGNIMELFKMQVLMKYIGETKTPQASFVFMILMMFYDHLSKNFPALVLAGWLWAQKRWGTGPVQPANLIKPAVEPPRAKQIRAFIQFEKDATSKVIDPRIDAVMNCVCQLPEVRSLRFNGTEFIPNFSEPLMIDSDIWFEIVTNSKVTLQLQGGVQQAAESLVYKLSSYDHDITYLHRFVERCIQNFEQEKKNKLGSETYYFDQVVSIGGGRMKLPVPGGFCAFRKSKFQSNRALSNIYLRQIEELRGRVEFFLRRRDWYDSKGIPHTLGIMMWGHPGCGKTSTIKAIANETKRHIFNVSLSEIKTKDALKDLFYNETIHVYNGEKLEQLTIPLKQRLYVVEDVDAMSSVVIKRGFKDEAAEAKKAELKARKADILKKLGREDEDGCDDELDLSTLLNVLDGVRETPGRIIILSTNYPERLDEALLRPGRFDVILEYEKHSRAVLKTHIEGFYDVTLSAEQTARIDREMALEKKWTPAEVSQILFKNIMSLDGALSDLIEKTPAELFRFSQMNGVGTSAAESEGGISAAESEAGSDAGSETDSVKGDSESSEKTDPKTPVVDMEEYAAKKEHYNDFLNRISKSEPSQLIVKEIDERIAFRNENSEKILNEIKELEQSPQQGTPEELKAVSRKLSELYERLRIRQTNNDILTKIKNKFELKMCEKGAPDRDIVREILSELDTPEKITKSYTYDLRAEPQKEMEVPETYKNVGKVIFQNDSRAPAPGVFAIKEKASSWEQMFSGDGGTSMDDLYASAL